MISRDMEIQNRLGLHARAAVKLVNLASLFRSDIKITRGGEVVDGKSLLGILLLAAGRGTVISVRAEGEDEGPAIEAMQELIDRKFDEE